MLDVLGIGFGPANVALAAALSELPATAGMRVRFFEKQPEFGWHRSMLIEGATLQVAFLKDLVTLRNPVSPLSFVSYLTAKGRLVDFINHKTLYPTRLEFHDYLEWAAGHFGDQVAYGAEVVSAQPHVEDGRITHFTVQVHHAPTDRMAVYRARNVVVAPGLSPYLPDGVSPDERVWHSSELLGRLARLPSDAAPRRFVVVGAGQSAAEITDHLHRSYPTAEVCSVFGGFGYSPADDSPFVNQVFDPATVDLFHGAPAEARRTVFDRHRSTNYSVADLDLIEELYRRAYEEKVAGVNRLRFLRGSRVVTSTSRPDAVDVTVASLLDGAGGPQTLTADAVVYATGYRPADLRSLLGDVSPLLERDAQGELVVARDYRAALHLDCAGGVYLQGGTEHTHGISSSLLSNAAVRAGEIAASVAERSAAAQVPALATADPGPGR
ncbi:lysine N(6)-hydroxylase/L-ornithine N(5)-oxygenase family protein [Streptomyces polychromogenes]|uniref:L-lysine N6-monooxygenase MbtG n=1 Tax=Streptomyces polychromogenes TaxID=67342 RepID=A0ABP3ELJ7_9ACTN